MTRIGYLVLAFGELLLLIAAVRLLVQGRRLGMLELWIPVVLLAGLVYDNSILGLGASIGEGDLLRRLSVPRFVTHVLLTPTLMIFAAVAAGRLGIAAYRARRRLQVWTALSIGAIVLGVATDLVGFHLVAKTESGVLRYTHAEPVVPIATVLTIVGLLVIGTAMWRGARWPWLLVASIVMFVLAATFAGTGLFTNTGELILLAAVVATAREALSRYGAERDALPEPATA